MAMWVLTNIWDFARTTARCISRRRRRVWSPCRVAVHVVAIFGVINIAWFFIAVANTEENGLEQNARRTVYDSPAYMQLSHTGPKMTNKDIPDVGNEAEKSGKTGRVHSDTVQREKELQNNTKANPATDSFPPWCSGKRNITAAPKADGSTREVNYFLTAVLLVRIYSYDLAKLTTDEMFQWLQYLSYAGVEHVYVYDAYLYKNESQKELLGCFIHGGYVTYVDWSHKARPKFTIAGTQVPAYQDCINRFGSASVWQTPIDIDEYPFCPNDREPGFLARAVRKISTTGPSTGEISMQNYLYLGKPLDKSAHPLLIDRIWRRTKNRANPLVKPIYQPKAIQQANVHHNSLKMGFVNYAPSENIIRLSHYWGARLQGWGEDTPKVLAMTMEDRGMERAVEALTSCVRGCKTGCCHN